MSPPRCIPVEAPDPTATGDAELPHLARALDGGRMLPWLARASGLPEPPRGLSCSVEVLSHKPGRRCTLRYRFTREGSGAADVLPRPIIGKLYRSRRRARRTCERMRSLAAPPPGGAGLPSIPVCLLWVPPLGLLLQECLDGVELDHVVASGDATRPLTLAARWLRGLHAAPRPEGLPTASPARCVEKVEGWCRTLASRLPDRTVSAVEAQQRFEARAQGAAPAPVLIHRDFYHAQVLWNGEDIGVLDFDELSLGDPAFDVGHFLAHLDYKAYLRTGSEHGYRAAASCFVAGYGSDALPALGERLTLYRGYTFLKLAHTEVVRQRRAWRRRAGVLMDLALRELGAPAAPGATGE